jgi:hypothetical protein
MDLNGIPYIDTLTVMARKTAQMTPIFRLRIPLPEKTGGFHTSPSGKKGYDQKRGKTQLRREVRER